MKELQTAAGFKQPKDENGNEPKEIDTKKVVAAIMTALEHKLGRPATTAELVEALSEKDTHAEEQEAAEQEQNASLPEMLSYKMHFGLSQNAEGSKEPDPTKTLFYSNADNTSWYDVDAGTWVFDKPKILDHLYERNLGDSEDHRDIFDLIINGALSDDDYNLLNSRPGMLDSRSQRAFELQKRAKEQFSQLQELEKSIALPEDSIADNQEPEITSDNIGSILTAAGLDSSIPEAQEPLVEVGSGGAHTMRESALGNGVEYRLRRWIAAEIQAAIPSILEALLTALNGTEDEGTEDPEEVKVQQEVALGLPADVQ